MLTKESTKKNILTIIGSNNINSESKMIFDEIFKKINFDKNYEYKEIVLSDYYLKYCKGCKSCFKEGYCHLDKKDDMYIIRRELKRADIVFFVVPVYAHDIPGKMKNMIDRLSYEFHLMSLCKKVGFSIVVTDLTGAERVIEYIYDIFTNLGIKQLESYSYKHCIDYKETNIDIFEDIAYSIKKQIDNNNDFTNDDLEYFYSYYKEKYNSNNANLFDNIEIFWNKAEVKLSTTFQEFCKKSKAML